jgi:hypothetical protein
MVDRRHEKAGRHFADGPGRTFTGFEFRRAAAERSGLVNSTGIRTGFDFCLSTTGGSACALDRSCGSGNELRSRESGGHHAGCKSYDRCRCASSGARIFDHESPDDGERGGARFQSFNRSRRQISSARTCPETSTCSEACAR